MAAALLVAACASYALLRLPAPAAPGVFSWSRAAYQADADRTLRTLQRLGARQLYQSFDDEGLSGTAARTFSAALQENGIELYALLDSGAWTSESLPQLEEKLRAILAFHAAGSPLRGVMLDIEPYQSDAWEASAEAILQQMQQELPEFYARASSAGLTVYLCMPVYWADKYPDAVRDLSRFACDGVCVMNYDRVNELENMAFFVKTAKAEKKEVLCAFEFQAAGSHGLTANQTYSGVGLAEALRGFQAIYAQYRYPKLRLAYHYLDPVEAMLDETEIS